MRKPKAGERWWVYTRRGMIIVEVIEYTYGPNNEYQDTGVWELCAQTRSGNCATLTADGELADDAPPDWILLEPVKPPAPPKGRRVPLDRPVVLNGERGYLWSYEGLVRFSTYKVSAGRAVVLVEGDLISVAGELYTVGARDKLIRMEPLPQYLRAEPGPYRPRPGARLAPYRHLLGSMPDAAVARLAGVGRSCASRMRQRLLQFSP